MTPEQYIEQLKEVQRTLDSVKEDLESAIFKMQRRLETGYESQERMSRLLVLASREYVKRASNQLLAVGTATIEY